MIHFTMLDVIKCFNCLLISFIISSQIFCQDTLYHKGKILTYVDFWGSKIFENTYSPGVSMAENIRLQRKNSPSAVSDFNYATDNPLRHGAFYAALKNKVNITEGLEINFDLYGEIRGISYGVSNTENMIVYPIINLKGVDSFFINKKKFTVYGKVGQFIDEKLHEGLLIYNVDAQGLQAELEFSQFKISYTLYGDFYNGIGLNIDDLHAITISRYLKQGNIQVGFSLYSTAPPHENKKNNLRYSLFSHYKLKRGSLYAQLGYRAVDNSQSKFETGLDKQIAFVIGLRTKHGDEKLFWNNQAELRYYGKSFNARHFEYKLLYRDPIAVSGLYANTIGEFLYLLRKFETPFSQWAVFTEYQGSNVFCFSSVGALNWKFSKKFDADLEYDLNLIMATTDTAYTNANTNFFYPFFTFGIYYTPIRSFRVGAILTNKGMNLDLSYPTFYLYSRPYFGIKMSTKIAN
jgi:hypothetical protein